VTNLAPKIPEKPEKKAHMLAPGTASASRVASWVAGSPAGARLQVSKTGPREVVVRTTAAAPPIARGERGTRAAGLTGAMDAQMIVA
jgi:hypothetical protein